VNVDYVMLRQISSKCYGEILLVPLDCPFFYYPFGILLRLFSKSTIWSCLSERCELR